MKKLFTSFLMLAAATTATMAQSLAVNVTEAGTLGTLVGDANKLTTTTLKVTGTINAADLQYIREMANCYTGALVDGSTTEYYATHGKLANLDLSGATIAGDGTFKVYSWNGTSVDAAISSTTIGENAFAEVYELKSLILPKGITEIKKSALSNSSVTSLTISEGLTKLSQENFSFTKLESVSLPDGLTEIGDYAFASSKLTNINLPASLTKIGDYAFQETAITSLVIPEKADYGWGSFGNCSTLTSMVINSKNAIKSIPSNVKDITITASTDVPCWVKVPSSVNIHVAASTIANYKSNTNIASANFDSNFPLTLSTSYASFSSALNLDFSAVEGLKAYTGKYDSSADAVDLTEVGKTPGSTGLILSGTAGTTYNVPILDADATTDDVADNELKPCVAPVWSDNATDYFLYNGQFARTDNAGYVPAGKAYISVDRTATSTPMMLRIGGQPLSIGGISAPANNADNAYYTIGGMKVQNPTRGLYIHNGKKIMVK